MIDISFGRGAGARRSPVDPGCEHAGVVEEVRAGCTRRRPPRQPAPATSCLTERLTGICLSYCSPTPNGIGTARTLQRPAQRPVSSGKEPVNQASHPPLLPIGRARYPIRRASARRGKPRAGPSAHCSFRQGIQSRCSAVLSRTSCGAAAGERLRFLWCVLREQSGQRRLALSAQRRTRSYPTRARRPTRTSWRRWAGYPRTSAACAREGVAALGQRVVPLRPGKGAPRYFAGPARP